MNGTRKRGDPSKRHAERVLSKGNLRKKLQGVIDLIPEPWDPGDLKVSARNTPSEGWLLCDGSAVSRDTYADLFAAIGTTYGAGNGSTTFNVPDFRSRAIVGAGSGPGLSVRNRGDMFGTESRTLSTNQLPPHNHEIRFNRLSDVPTNGSSARVTNIDTGLPNFGSSVATGNGDPFNIVQPSAVARVFIKT